MYVCDSFFELTKSFFYNVLVFKNQTRIVLKTTEEFHDFAKDYRIIHAAGGIVHNEKDEILMIYRLDKWDFPKGKVEAGEQIPEAALREVEEETGLQHITLEEPLPSTFHTYELNGQPILKETHWFRMSANTQSLTPQTVEDITQAVWVPREQVPEKMENSYPSLKWLWENC